MSTSATIHVSTLRRLLVGLREGMTAAELVELTGRPRSSLYRDLAAVRELGVVLAPRPRRGGEDPPFRVVAWGPFDPGRLDAAAAPADPAPREALQSPEPTDIAREDEADGLDVDDRPSGSGPT